MATIFIPLDVNGDSIIHDTIDGYGLIGELPGGCVSNGCEVKFRQADPAPGNTTGKVVGPITVSGTGTAADGEYTFFEIGAEGTPTYSFGVWRIVLWATGWTLVDDTLYSEYWEHPTATGMFPPKTWPNDGTIGGAASPPPTLTYSRWWIDDSDDDDIQFAEKSHADFLARTNGEDDQIDQWEKLGAGNVCCVTESILYPGGTVEAMTQAQYNQMVRWAGDATCGAGMTPYLFLLITGTPFLLVSGSGFTLLG